MNITSAFSDTRPYIIWTYNVWIIAFYILKQSRVLWDFSDAITIYGLQLNFILILEKLDREYHTTANSENFFSSSSLPLLIIFKQTSKLYEWIFIRGYLRRNQWGFWPILWAYSLNIFLNLSWLHQTTLPPQKCSLVSGLNLSLLQLVTL